jgi:arsenate reductase
MAEALLRKLGSDKFEAYSAGLEPKDIHPLTIEVLKEIGIEIAGQKSKDMKEYFGKQTFQYLVTVCDNADEKCPTTWPGVMHRYHWAFEDPAAAKGTHEEQMNKFRKVRDQIKDRIEAWLKDPSIGLRDKSSALPRSA